MGLLKQKIVEKYKQGLNDHLALLQKKLQDLIESTKNETKSSAGDKYETSRAMLQIEQDNVRKQQKQALEKKASFEKIDFDLTPARVSIGSLVKTDKNYFFITVALGKTEVNGSTVIAISPQSPLGSKLLGLKSEETVNMNGTVYTIKSFE